MRLSGRPDGDLESQFSACAREICGFPFSSTLPPVASLRSKVRKTPFIRHMHIPSFMLLTNPPSGSIVWDGVLRGVQLQEMLPRKGIATPGGAQKDGSLARLCCKRCFPVRGLRHRTSRFRFQCFITSPRLQEMLPRKGIATLREVPGLPVLNTRGCKRCFPVRGLRHIVVLEGADLRVPLQEMLPRKGIATS